jgi:hypothetical protein
MTDLISLPIIYPLLHIVESYNGLGGIGGRPYASHRPTILGYPYTPHYESPASHSSLVEAGGLPLGQATNDFQSDESNDKTHNVSCSVNY